MSNQSESKEELILSAAVEILTNDTASTGNTVREIEFYVADRIQREFAKAAVTLPNIDITVEAADTPQSLPTGTYFLDVIPKEDQKVSFAQTIIDRIAARVEFLFNKKPDALNLAAVVSGKNLRCRLIKRESALRNTDTVLQIHSKTIRFQVICDDEILN